MKQSIHLIIVCVLFFATSCSYSKKFSKEFYAENKEMLHKVKEDFRLHYETRPFAIGIRDRYFEQIDLLIITDSIRYIYGFNVSDPKLIDTLRKYQFDIDYMESLINDMQDLHCTWLSNLTYYENFNKKNLVFLSIRHSRLESSIKKNKYFTLAFFESPQPFDERGRLLDKADKKKPRRINGAIFYRIDDRVAFAISNNFR